MSEALFVWNNGDKLFIGGANARVSIYSLNPSNGLYIQPPNTTPSLNVNIIMSIWVSVAGDSIFASTNDGCFRIVLNGTNWVLNTPSYLATLGTNQFNLIKFINNQ